MVNANWKPSQPTDLIQPKIKPKVFDNALNKAAQPSLTLVDGASIFDAHVLASMFEKITGRPKPTRQEIIDAQNKLSNSKQPGKRP